MGAGKNGAPCSLSFPFQAPEEGMILTASRITDKCPNPGQRFSYKFPSRRDREDDKYSTEGVGWGRGRHAWNLMSLYCTTKDTFWTMKWSFYQLGKVNDIWFSF